MGEFGEAQSIAPTTSNMSSSSSLISLCGPQGYKGSLPDPLCSTRQWGSDGRRLLSSVTSTQGWGEALARLCQEVRRPVDAMGNTVDMAWSDLQPWIPQTVTEGKGFEIRKRIKLKTRKSPAVKHLGRAGARARARARKRGNSKSQDQSYLNIGSSLDTREMDKPGNHKVHTSLQANE